MGASLERSEPIRAATWDDFEHVVDLLVAQSRAATGIAGVRPEFVRTDWELPSFEVGRDNWLAGSAGYAAVSPKGSLVVTAPDAATADALLARAVASARERGLRKLELAPIDGDACHAGLLQAHPFELEVDLLAMWRPLKTNEAEPNWPDGFSARTFQLADAIAVHSLLDEAYGAWDGAYVPLAHEDWKRSMTGDVEFDATTWWLAERDGELAGCALWWKSGWLKDIVVREGDRGRGLARALLEQGFAEFARRGEKRVGLKVDSANPTGAVALYERNGFRVDRREQHWALSL